MNNWIPKSKTVKFAIITASLSVALYFIGLFIVSREIKKVENLYLSADSKVSREEKSFAIRSIAETNKENIQTLRDFFIKAGDEVKFIEQIEEVARESSVKFEIVSIDAKASNDSAKEDVNIKINIEGSWGNIMNFAGKLEKMPFGVLVQKISLNTNTPGSWSGAVDIVVFREK